MRVKWQNFRNETFRGEVIEVDNGTLIVKCDDGVTRATSMEGCVPDDPKFPLD
jgi:translation initiation factor IF-1